MRVKYFNPISRIWIDMLLTSYVDPVKGDKEKPKKYRERVGEALTLFLTQCIGIPITTWIRYDPDEVCNICALLPANCSVAEAVKAHLRGKDDEVAGD